MGLSPQQNPWVGAAGAAGQGADSLTETLMRLPFLQQQLQQGQLQQQLLQGQIGQLPLHSGLIKAQTSMASQHGDYFGARADEETQKAHMLQGQNDALALLKTALASNGIPVQGTPAANQFQSGIIGLPPADMSKVMEALQASMGLMNPQISGDPRIQAGALLGDRTAAQGTTVPANGINYPPGGGAPMLGTLMTRPGMQALVPQGTGFNPTYSMQANTNLPPVGSRSSAEEARLVSAELANNPDMDVQTAVQIVRKAIDPTSGQTQPPPGAKQLDAAKAMDYLMKAGGDKNKARQAASADGYTF